ncbi:MAG TPA: hypothetical protein IAB44_12610 [Candidatus Limivivens intestinipullorum]|uniref:Peptidase S54 rhomboid domain-containing protein n=1 Tax=Candidatus Limivivens intestinipullorum TaxID=2840858 RepID=A0A9D1EU92_9FIRM|nr:hypothetical protein [Candidatus Limivivens intestinipullorum]
MKFLNKLERKFGRYAIHNLAAYIIGMYVIGYVFYFFMPDIFQWLTLEPYYILRGQIWRLVTWLLIPPESPGIFTIIMLFFYYSLGISLERAWGAFRFNVYILLGMISTVLGAFLLYAILGGGRLFGNAFFSTYYINMSIFLAFAMSYPNERVYLYFFIPVKMKWMGYLYLFFIVYSFVTTSWVGRVAILASLLNFIVFFLITRDYRRISPGEFKRRYDFKKNVQPNPRRSGGSGPVTKHKCAVCGRTELDGDDLEFRFCSKCDGNYEYCQDHLFTHKHVHKN